MNCLRLGKRERIGKIGTRLDQNLKMVFWKQKEEKEKDPSRPWHVAAATSSSFTTKKQRRWWPHGCRWIYFFCRIPRDKTAARSGLCSACVCVRRRSSCGTRARIVCLVLRAHFSVSLSLSRLTTYSTVYTHTKYTRSAEQCMHSNAFPVSGPGRAKSRDECMHSCM